MQSSRSACRWAACAARRRTVRLMSLRSLELEDPLGRADRRVTRCSSSLCCGTSLASELSAAPRPAAGVSVVWGHGALGRPAVLGAPQLRGDPILQVRLAVKHPAPDQLHPGRALAGNTPVGERLGIGPQDFARLGWR